MASTSQGSSRGISATKPFGNGVWTVYVVAEIYGKRRPLAAVVATSRTNRDTYCRELISMCSRIKTTLSNRAARLAIDAEQAMAIDFYRDANKWPESTRYGGKQELLHPFPFTSACLLLAGISGFGCSIGCVKSIHLDSIYVYGHYARDAMVIFDVTDRDYLRYGIINFDLIVDSPGDGVKSFGTIEIGQAIRPLSAKELAVRLGYNECIKAVEEMEQLPVVGACTIDFTSPFDNTSIGPGDGAASIKPLCDLAIITLIDSTRDIEEFDMSIFDRPRLLPGFKDWLQHCLPEKSETLGHSYSFGQLIRLAFEGTTHLDLVRFKGLSADVISFLLQAEELKDVKSISLCIDNIPSSAAAILDSVSHSSSLRELYIHQEPMRKSDDPSFRLHKVFLQRRHLQRRIRITFAAAFSVTLDHTPLLGSPLTCHPLPDVLPVHHMTISHPERINLNTSMRSEFSCHCQTQLWLGHGFFESQKALAAELLQFLAHVPTFKFPFSTAPPPPRDMSYVEIRPVLTWLKPQDLKSGSWVMIVSEYLLRSYLHIVGGWKLDEERPAGARYAFAHLLVDVKEKCLNHHRYDVKPADITVVGLKAFLNATAQTEDSAKIDELFAMTTTEIAEKTPDSFDWSSVLNPDEVCILMNNFLNSTPEGGILGVKSIEK